VCVCVGVCVSVCVCIVFIFLRVFQPFFAVVQGEQALKIVMRLPYPLLMIAFVTFR